MTKDRTIKMRKWKSILYLTISLIGSLFMFSSCQINNNVNQEDEGDTQDSVLSAFIQQSVTSDSGIWEGWAAQKLYEDTNIRVDFYATGSEVEQKLKQYIAAGTIPDIIGFRDLDQAQLVMDAGLLLPLDKYKDILPAIFKTPEYEKAIKFSRENTSNKSGRLYLMPTSVGPVSYNAYNWMPMLQWDAYKKVGKPKIDTLEDYLDVVEAMVQVKQETEDGKKVYGFSLFSDWDSFSALEVAALSYFYGIDTEYVSPLMETNVTTKITKSILHEDSFYKRALYFYFCANQRGLLDPDSMTQSYSTVEQKFSEGRIMFSWFSWLTGNYNETTSGNVNSKDSPDGYANIPAGDMKIYEAPDQLIGRNWYFGISNHSKSVEKACEFLNWLYDPKVEHYLYNGPEGYLWEYQDNGEPVVTEEGWEIIDRKDESIMTIEEGGSFEGGQEPFNALGLQASTKMEDGYSISYRYWPSVLERGKSLMEKEVNQMLNADTIAEYLYDNNMVAKSTVAVNMIPTVSDEMKSKIGVIGELVREYSWKMIYAENEEQFQAYWESMTTEAKNQGIDQVEEYYQESWENALEKVSDYE